MTEENSTVSTDESLQIFDFNDNKVRIVDIDGDPWFVAKDVCKVLGIKNHKMAVKVLDEDEIDEVYTTDPIGRKQKTLIISESGMYAIVFQSRKPVAKQFSKWVRNVVLKSIRKRGFFQMEDEDKDDLEILLEENKRAGLTLQKLVEQRRKLRAHERKLQLHESIVNDHENRLGLIEKTSKDNSLRLMYVERSDEPVKEKSVRSKLNQIVRAYCLAKHVSYSEAWRYLYTEHKYRYHKDVVGRWSRKVRKLERAGNGEKVKFDKLDMAEEMGCMDELYSLASAVFASN